MRIIIIQRPKPP